MKPFQYPFLLVLLLTFGCKEQSNTQSESIPPNVIIILTDDQGWGDLSFNGNKNLATPNIDAIAKGGAVFDNFLVQPVCSPTRAELLTGQYFPRLGVYATSAGGERMNLNVPTLADYFRQSGYSTAAYGKWHNGMQPPYHPNSRGFTDFYGFCSGHWGNYFSPMLERNGEIVKGNGFLVDDLFDHGLEFISKNKTEPFLLYLPVNTPHSPMQVPDSYWNNFKDKELESLYSGTGEEDIQFTKAALAMVENIDWNVGRLISHLKSNNLEQNTIVVFMSDNGPNAFRWNGGLRGKKGSTDEGGVKSPFFIKWPAKIAPGQRFEQLMGSVDLLPTLGALASVSFPEDHDMDGTDFSALILGQGSMQKDKVVFNLWNSKTSVRTQEYRLDSEDRLYHMQDDPGQTMDLSEQLPMVRDSLMALKNQWLTEVFPNKNTVDKRPFTVGDPSSIYTQLPARDAEGHGNITRSNRFPNDSFLTNWLSTKDSITWDVDVLQSGRFEASIYYTCPPESVGTELQLQLGKSSVMSKIPKAHDSSLLGAEHDKFPRMESYVKDFIPFKLGEIELQKGASTLVLKANQIPGETAIDFRLLLLQRLE